MTVTLSLVVSHADVPEGHPLRLRQSEGIESMQEMAFGTDHVTLQIVPSDEKPLVHDLMDQAMVVAGDFVGFLNSDDITTGAFLESIPRWAPYDAIRVRRTDIKNGKRLPTKNPSAEGIIMRREVWERLGKTYPHGMRLGEPGWDTCWIMWIHHHQLRVGRLDSGEVLHPWHEPSWKSRPYREWENVKLMMRWLTNAKGRARAWRIMNCPTTCWDDIEGREEIL